MSSLIYNRHWQSQSRLCVVLLVCFVMGDAQCGVGRFLIPLMFNMCSVVCVVVLFLIAIVSNICSSQIVCEHRRRIIHDFPNVCIVVPTHIEPQFILVSIMRH